MRRTSFTLLLALQGASCSSTPPTQSTRAVQTSEPTELTVLERVELRALLEEAGMQGTITLLQGEQNEVVCSHASLCRERLLPASTFKIPNALIGLETGVIADADFVIPWDGVTRDFPDWNRDHTLRTAIKFSVVPYFQELARRVGPEREAEWVRRLGYGNADTGIPSQVDRFWLDGPLAISPVEQVQFLRRLAHDRLPVTARSAAIVRDILVLAQQNGATLRGKTGWGQPHRPEQLGWFVGYAERDARRTYVAVLLQGQPNQDDAKFLAARRSIAERALSQLQAW